MLRYIEWKGGHEESYWDYWYWLVELVSGFDEDEPLLRKLYSVEFTWTEYMDKNRSMDGLALRKRWIEGAPVSGDVFGSRPCSVLEMLVALALRIEDDVIGDPTIEFFWTMIDNLRLRTASPEEQDYILEYWMERRFDRMGFGSPFPVYEDNRDQRKLEIWSQCMNYLNENDYY